MKRVESTPEEAKAAMDARNWSVAAERWYGIFAGDMTHRPEACEMAARAMIEMKDWQNASHVLDLGLRFHPTNVNLLEEKGLALANLKFARAAADCFERVVELEPGRTQAWVELGRAHMDLGLELAAARAFEQALDLQPDDASVWIDLGRARARGSDPQGALAAYATGFDREPGKVDDLIEAAQQCALPGVKQKRTEYLELGLGWLCRVTMREPQHVLAHFELGVLCEELGRKDEAVEHYRRAIELDLSNLAALRNLAVLYASMGNVEGTREMVERSLALEHDPDRRTALQNLLESVSKPRDPAPAPEADGKPTPASPAPAAPGG
ncbi:MAG: tetratricopeptide repeat protein [Planctomycetes bacterium]|nr:tetratricopeptide repeat protein [Planctomycetota bacterium]